jgi:hypothetical protein
MIVAYTVQRSDPQSAAPNLLRLWRNNLPVDGDVRRKLDWLYRDPPDRPSEVFLLVSDTEETTPIVGTAGFGVRRFQVAGRSGRAALLADLAVDQAHRTVMPALKLVREVRSAMASFDLIYGFPNKHAEGVFRRAGYRELGRSTRYVRVLRHASYLARLVPVPLLPRLAGPVLDLAVLVRRLPAMLRSRQTCRLVWLPDVDARFDRLWDAARADYRTVGYRGSDFLRWRFLRHPSDSFQVVALLRGDGESSLAAYAVLRRKGAVVHIADLFGHTADLGSLVDLLIGVLWRQGTVAISFTFLGSQRVVGLLKERGFKARESVHRVFFDAGDSLRGVPIDLSDLEEWHLTDGDEDT